MSSLLIVLSVLFPSNIFAFEFAGLQGKDSNAESTVGDPEDIDWPEAFLKEVEAAQAIATQEVSKLPNWHVIRSIQGRVVENEKEKQLFEGEDLLIPKNNKCSNLNVKKVSIYSTVIDRSFQTVKGFGEFTAVILGEGWDCDAEIDLDYWQGEGQDSVEAQEAKETHGTDDSYIKNYLGKTKNISYPKVEIGEDENYFFTNAPITTVNKNLAKGNKFVKENCVCPPEAK